MPKNYEAREMKLKRRKNAMKVNARGLLTVIQPLIAKKGREAKQKDANNGTR